MAVCESCGGVIGRDCFNPDECAMISHHQETVVKTIGMIAMEKRLVALEQKVNSLEKIIYGRLNK